MNRLHTIRVVPNLPEALQPLRRIAYDLHWTWSHDALELFLRLDRELWEQVDHNPIQMLSELSQQRLEEVAADEAFLNHLQRVEEGFESYRAESSWYQAEHKSASSMHVAYFSAEFGLHESLPIYSGGLGLLAGDHLKAASDLAVPLIGVGLLYQRGYFRQYLNADGMQHEKYPAYDMFNMPLELLRDDKGQAQEVVVRVGGHDVHAAIWRVRVGRVNLYLLDTNHRSNRAEDRLITENLYGGDNEMRIRQEIILGIGGVKALRKLGLDVTVYHMNEGHSAFLALECIREKMAEGDLTFDEAYIATRVNNVFTTHTPVPAGIDRFSQELMDRYFKDFWPLIGLDRDSFLQLGGASAGDPGSLFNMATMAINLAAFVNGVSQLHGEVSRSMWRHLWPGIDASEAPIQAITNGVHARSWISPEISHLFDRYLGPTWQENPRDEDIWRHVQSISPEELWRTRERMRERLVVFARRRLQQQYNRRGESRTAIDRAGEVLDMDALTIGFARRFATYKRATLLMRDPERLKRILTDPERPVQIIIAGKAHPKDEPGKQMIKDIVHFARDPELRRHIVFVEDYDINTARALVQGCDVWLNNPRPPMEASGTSGMKAAVNGVLNCSTLDGWWAEAYDSSIGWTIGHGETYEDSELQDKIESDLLYDLLENEIVPLFYTRDQGRLPRDWIAMIKNMLEVLPAFFITTRMVAQYTEQGYLPSHQRAERVQAEGFKRARELSQWQGRVRAAWSKVAIEAVSSDEHEELSVGDRIKVEARVQLGDLRPEDVEVQIYEGPLNSDRSLSGAASSRVMKAVDESRGAHIYHGEIELPRSGLHGFAIRVLPSHEDLNHPMEMRLVTWES